MNLYHLDTDLLIYALSQSGKERRRLGVLVDSNAVLQMAAVAWYEFSRGPRTAEQLAVARVFLGDNGVVPFSEDLAQIAAETFRLLGSPRRRAADIAIGVTAQVAGAVLLSRNRRDFAGIPGLTVEAA